MLDERNDSIVECIGVREFGVVANVYPTVEEMWKAIDKLGMNVDKEQDLESICEELLRLKMIIIFSMQLTKQVEEEKLSNVVWEQQEIF